MNRSKYAKNIIFYYLNIDSIRHKFENLKEVVSNYDDIFAITETKADINRSLRDISDKNGALLVYLRSYLLSRPLIKFEISSGIQVIPFEVNIKEEKLFFKHMQATFYKHSIFL